MVLWYKQITDSLNHFWQSKIKILFKKKEINKNFEELWHFLFGKFNKKAHFLFLWTIILCNIRWVNTNYFCNKSSMTAYFCPLPQQQMFLLFFKNIISLTCSKIFKKTKVWRSHNFEWLSLSHSSIWFLKTN